MEIKQEIPLSVPNLRGREKEYIVNAIDQEWVSIGGPYIEEFERSLGSYVGAPYAVACQSGTAGLHLSLIARGIGSGHEVIVPALTFIASVNPVRYVGAEPVFMDCDDTLCMDMGKLCRFCREECNFVDGKLYNKQSGRHIAAVIVAHIFGNLADMDALMDIAGQYNLYVIEDAAEALGSLYLSGRYAGRHAGTIGDIGICSFNGNKIVTTGGGGMVISTDEMSIRRIKHLSTQAKSDPIYFFHDEMGYNYRMTNLQAVVGLGQLEQLETFIEHKKGNYFLYKELGLDLLPFREDIRPNYWFYSYLTTRRDELITFLSHNEVQSRPIWHLINRLPFYSQCQNYRIEKAAYYWERIVNIPCSSNLTVQQVRRVAELIKQFDT